MTPPPPPAPDSEPPSRPADSAAADAPPARPARRPLTLRNYAWIAGAALVVVLALRFLGPVLTPFLIGAILAYLGTPIVTWAAGRGVPRALATTLVVALFGLLLLALFLVLVPLVQAEVMLAARRLPDLVAQATAQVAPWLQQHFGVTPSFDLESLKSLVSENMDDARDLSLRLLSGVTAGGLIVVSILVNVVLIPVVMFYLLRDWDMIAERLDTLVPRAWHAKVRTIVVDIDRVLAEFLRGQLAVMLVLAVYYAAALWLAGLDRALAIGLLTGLLVFIPYVGFGLGLILGVIAALLQWSGWPGFLAVLAVYGVGQLVEGYVLVPYLVGDRIGLHPLAVIFALLAFGQLFGFAGVLLALPVSAALLVGLRHLRAAYLESPVYRGTH
ncbi:MAG: AI-2E family transporter [Betaproteobacteria bacterium]|nr:AI-2E family transporter [Betaproteobacteria bacterium]